MRPPCLPGVRWPRSPPPQVGIIKLQERVATRTPPSRGKPLPFLAPSHLALSHFYKTAIQDDPEGMRHRTEVLTFNPQFPGTF